VHGGQARLIVMSQDGEMVRKKCQRWNTPWQAHGLTFSFDALRQEMLMTGQPVIRVVERKAPSLPAPPSRSRRANTAPLRGEAVLLCEVSDACHRYVARALLRSTSDARRPRLEGATNQSTSLGWAPAGLCVGRLLSRPMVRARKGGDPMALREIGIVSPDLKDRKPLFIYSAPRVRISRRAYCPMNPERIPVFSPGVRGEAGAAVPGRPSCKMAPLMGLLETGNPLKALRACSAPPLCPTYPAPNPQSATLFAQNHCRTWTVP